MSTITSLYNQVKSLDIQKISVESLEETTAARIEANKDQMAKGLNPQGGIIGIYASRQYAAFKQALGSQAPFGIVDLKLTKAFIQGIKSSISGGSISTDSTDPKSAELQGKYGNVFGLSTPYKIDYIEKDLRPKFNSKIESALNLKMK